MIWFYTKKQMDKHLHGLCKTVWLHEEQINDHEKRLKDVESKCERLKENVEYLKTLLEKKP